MKLLKISLLLFSFALLFSCNKKTTAATVAEAIPTEKTTATPTTERPRRDGRRSGRNPETLKQERQKIYAQLYLSEAQIVKAEEIAEKYQEQRKTLRAKSNGDRAAMRAEMQKQREAQNKEMSGIMTKEQYARYLDHLRAAREKRGGRRGGPPGGRDGK